MSNLEKLNEQLAAIGKDTIKDIDACPERTAYLEHIMQDTSEFDSDDWKKFNNKKKALLQEYLGNFYTHFADTYPHLLFEEGEDKVYWNYDPKVGIYNEINFSTVRGYVIALAREDELSTGVHEAFAKRVLADYRAMYPDRGHHYDDFDSHAELFHASNGWIHVRTLKFQKHTPDLLSRRVSAVAYDKKALCPHYDTFLDSQVQLKEDQVRVLDQFSGLLLTPDITQQKMLALIGKPGSGKSTLLDCWSDVLGDCSTQVGLHEIASDSFRFGGSALVGKQLCWFDEVEVTRSNMGNSLINLITGQYIRVERKGINGIVEADNGLKCVITANTLPRSAEMGIYRRMILMYFNYSFYDNMTANRDMRSILQKEASGILNRMLRGLADLNKHGTFTTIEGHDDLIEEYKASSNTVAEFLDEHFEFSTDADPISTKVLLEAYKNFSNDRYSESLTPQRFGMLMANHGLNKFGKIYPKKHRTGIKMWCGLKLKDCYQLNSAGFIREDDSDF